MCTNHFCMTVFCDGITNLRTAGTLPYDCIINRFSCSSVPDKSCFSLVTDTKNCNIIFVDICFFYKIFYYLYCICINFFRIMLYPSTFINILFMWKVCTTKQSTFCIKKKGFCSLCTLVNSQYIFAHNFLQMNVLYLYIFKKFL